MKALISILIVCSFNTKYYAQEKTTLNIQVDQDIFNPDNEDRNYTMGAYLDFSSHVLDSCFTHRVIQEKASWITKKIQKDYAGSIDFGNNSISFYFGGFTPDSIGTQSIVYGDRPFSSVTCISNGVNYSMSKDTDKPIGKSGVMKKKFKYRYVNVAVGVMGLNLAQSLQGAIHKSNPHYKDTVANITPLYPYGWRNQISSGGGITGLIQFGGNYLLTRNFLTRYITAPTNAKGWTNGIHEKLNFLQRHSEIKVGYQVMLGYYNNFQVNSEMRFGKINPANWVNSWITNGTASNFINQPKTKPNNRNVEFFLFGSVKANYMVYNSLLRGQIFDFLTFNNPSNYVLRQNEVMPFFLNANVGAGLKLGGLFLSYSPISIRTSELKTTSRYIRTHKWGEVRLNIQIENKKHKYDAQNI